MKRSTLRLVLILAVLCITGITVTQVYWVRKAFDLKEDAFTRDINTALFNVAKQIFEMNRVPSPVANPVKQLSSNYFVVMVNSDIDVSLLEFMLRTEFEKRDIKADFEYGIYNCTSDNMVYGNYISMEPSHKIEERSNLPKWTDETYYFGVQFPTREAHLINQMGIWSFSSLVLLLVIIFFGYTIFVIFRQKRLSEIQKDFINNMTHEFKTPISTIAVSTEVLKDPSIAQQPERLLNYATIIQNENNRMKQQVERVLQMARLEKEEIALKKERLAINEIIREAMQTVEHVIKEKNGTIEFRDQAPNGFIDADRLHLVNVVHNLLENAIKYCDRPPKIVVTTAIDGRKISITIADNGIGISNENLKRVFHRFYRVPTGNVHNVKGFGIGLHYVKLVVQAHGGEVGVTSNEGGSVFEIKLPAA